MKERLDTLKALGVSHYFDELQRYGMEEKIKSGQFTEEEQQKEFCERIEEYFAHVSEEDKKVKA